MGDIINLHKLRKRAAKRVDDALAATNRAVHGRTKAERVLEASRAQKLRRVLDAHKIEPGETQ